MKIRGARGPGLSLSPKKPPRGPQMATGPGLHYVLAGVRIAIAGKGLGDEYPLDFRRRP
jgi:hypothetical protein